MATLPHAPDPGACPECYTLRTEGTELGRFALVEHRGAYSVLVPPRRDPAAVRPTRWRAVRVMAEPDPVLAALRSAVPA